MNQQSSLTFDSSYARLLVAAAAAAGTLFMANSPMASVASPAQGESIARRWEGTVTFTHTLNWARVEVGAVVATLTTEGASPRPPATEGNVGDIVQHFDPIGHCRSKRPLCTVPVIRLGLHG